MPEKLAELFRGLELTLLEEICSRLRIAGELNEVTVQDIRALRSHGIGLEDIKRAISSTSGMGMEKLDSLLDDVVSRNQAYYNGMADLARVTAPEVFVSHEDIYAIYEQTRGTYRNLTRSMGFLVRQGRRRVLLPPGRAYQWALDSALMQVQSGAINYNQAISEAVRQLADSGLKTVEYSSGHVDSLDVAVRRAVMSGVNQINAQYREQSVDYLETDLVECTAHSGARDTGSGPANHKSWQGKVYRWSEKPLASKGQYPDFVGTTGYGTGEGLCGWNCRHNFYSFIEGVSERAYTDKELENIDPPPITFEGRRYTAYEATQKQRSLERTIRKQRRLKTAYEAAGLTEEAAAAKARLRILNEKYQAFSQAAGLPEQRERMKVLYQNATTSRSAGKALEKQEKSDIIEVNTPKEIQDVRNLSAYRKASIPKDVTGEYLTSSTPGIGNITYEDGYKVKGHQAEIETAEWLKKTFGGDIRLLKESDIKGQTMPDFLWNQKLWELKGTATINGADKLLQHAIKQIQENPGGVILNIPENIDMSALEKQLASRIHRSKITGLDLIFLTKDKLIKILRYKK